MIIPFMLDEVSESSDGESENAVRNAVDFLKGVLELMLDLHVHTEVSRRKNVYNFVGNCWVEVKIFQKLIQWPSYQIYQMVAQFFSNIFFFLNGALLNMLIDRGEELGLFFQEKSSKVSTKEQLNISNIVRQYFTVPPTG